jgi:Domain of unknown function (DUF5615)
MSRPRFLADHDFNERIVTGLLRREPVAQISHVRDFGLGSRSDTEILQFAWDQRFLVISHDVNTMSAAAYDRMDAKQSIFGLLLSRQSLPIATVIDNLVMIWAATEAEEWLNQVRYLPI